jgi:hypothetical protein
MKTKHLALLFFLGGIASAFQLTNCPPDVQQMAFSRITNNYPNAHLDRLRCLSWSLEHIDIDPNYHHVYYRVTFIEQGNRHTNAATFAGSEGWKEIECMGYSVLMETNGEPIHARSADGKNDRVTYDAVVKWNENPNVPGHHDLNPEN